MNLVHISPTYYSTASVVGGGERYPIYLIQAINLAALTLRLEVKNGLVAFGAQAGEYPVAPDVTCTVLRGDPITPLSIPSAGLRSAIRAADVVVVHQCLTPFGLYAAGHAKMLGKTVIGMDHGGGEHPLVRFDTESWNVFDLLVAYSDFGAQTFRTATVPTITIEGPVDTSYYRPNPTISRDPSLVLTVGRILPHKGIEHTVRSLGPTQRLLVAGSPSDPAYMAYLRALVRNSRKRVEFASGLNDEDVRTLMCQASVVVQASSHIDYRGAYYAKPELLGLAPLEALSCGTPALVSSAGALPELAAIAGCLVFTDDQGLATRLADVAANRLDLPGVDALHAQVEARYGLDTYGERFIGATLKVHTS